jgi:hypothetical protein
VGLFGYPEFAGDLLGELADEGFGQLFVSQVVGTRHPRLESAQAAKNKTADAGRYLLV